MEHRGTSGEMHTRTVFRTFVIYPYIRMTIVDVTTCCWFYIYFSSRLLILNLVSVYVVLRRNPNASETKEIYRLAYATSNATLTPSSSEF